MDLLLLPISITTVSVPFPTVPPAGNGCECTRGFFFPKVSGTRQSTQGSSLLCATPVSTEVILKTACFCFLIAISFLSLSRAPWPKGQRCLPDPLSHPVPWITMLTNHHLSLLPKQVSKGKQAPKITSVGITYWFVSHSTQSLFYSCSSRGQDGLKITLSVWGVVGV